MGDVYHLQNRRSSQSINLAPTASMISPHLDHNHRVTSHQLSQMQSHGSNMSGSQQQTSNAPNRALPTVEITDQSIDDAYVNFILYCNPYVPDDINTSELRKGFRSPPMGDGKRFSPFILFNLISRLERKEIKTWTQLVVELGVERPDLAKNQSTQKIQQYAARLKRWLHAFHVDAFFNYCLQMPSLYYTDIPQSIGEEPRDGIPPDEDLALRALLPEFRPKRGRRKADEIETDGNTAKKSQIQPDGNPDFFSFDEQYSATPASAMPWSAQPQQPQHDPWMAAQMAIAPKTPSTGQTPSQASLSAQSAGQQIRWRLNDHVNTMNTPITPSYPQSAITPRMNQSTSPSFDGSRTAHPGNVTDKASSSRRRRHGPAVSSAWPNGPTPGKPRGRPPNNRTTQNGPFSTFPVNPVKQGARNPPTNTESTSQATSVSPGPEEINGNSNQPSSQAIHFAPNAIVTDQSFARKPSKLQLQVPEHAGGPVRLATPPTVLINGESDRHPPYGHVRRSSADFFNNIDDETEEEVQEDGEDDEGDIDWKRRALVLKKKLQEKEEELKVFKRRVLEAVM